MKLDLMEVPELSRNEIAVATIYPKEGVIFSKMEIKGNDAVVEKTDIGFLDFEEEGVSPKTSSLKKDLKKLGWSVEVERS